MAVPITGGVLALQRGKPPAPSKLKHFVRSCTSSPLNAILTALIVAVSVVVIVALLQWALIDATWSGSSGKDCIDHSGACWIFLAARAQILMFGAYPAAEQWRVALALDEAPGQTATTLFWEAGESLAG